MSRRFARPHADATAAELPGPEECGCAPSPAELRALRPGVSRRAALGAGFAGVLALGGLVVLGGPTVSKALTASNALSASYPSWDDVQAAKANEAAAAAQVRRIQSLIQGLTSEVQRTADVALRAADSSFASQQEYFEASYRADNLQAQGDAESVAAKTAADQAGRLAAQRYRSGGDDTTAELFFSGSADSADDLLSRLGVMDKILARNEAVYADAVTARDSARGLTDQAVVARDERDRLQQVAEQKMVESQQAATAAQAALDAQTLYLADLQAQLAALQDTTAKTVAEYQAGVEAERIAREQREAAARAEAKRLADAAAAAAAGGGGGGGGSGSGGGSSGGGGSVVGSGWARPSSGRLTSGYGPRSSQCGNGYCSTSTHYGIDLSSGCGGGVYSAGAGTVVYAAYNGGYGNFIKIDHGGGIATGYAHIPYGGFAVSYGQQVVAGQFIATEGDTGNTFGCNLHFEAYQNGSPVNPATFLANRGVSV